MTVYKPKKSNYYYFDFWRGGKRYFGSTKRDELIEAEKVEQAHIARAEQEAEAASIADTAPEAISILPRHVLLVPFRKGARYFFSVPARMAKAGCPIKSQSLGLDYEAAVARAESVLLPALDRWTASQVVGPEEASLKLSTEPAIGVYLLMLKGKVVYVGTSRTMQRRVANHRTNGRPFDDVFYIAADESKRAKLEAALIKSISPPQNRTLIGEREPLRPSLEKTPDRDGVIQETSARQG
jgi:predicted GIY-YIG superfamily endonuclease